MSLSSFFKISGHNNLPGYYEFAFIPDDAIIYMPEPLNGIINMDDCVLTEGVMFFSGYCTVGRLSLGDDAKTNTHGSICQVEISGSAPVVHQHLHLFSKMIRPRHVVLARDNNGHWYVCGEPGNGMLFEFKRQPSSFDFSFKASYDHPCWLASGNVLVDGTLIDTGEGSSSGGGSGGGGTVTIKRSDATTIATITAPSEYAVMDSSIVVKNTDNTTLETTSVKAASSKIVTAPDSVYEIENSNGDTLSSGVIKSGSTAFLVAPDASSTLNGDPFLSLKSGTTVDIEILTADGDLADVSVAGNVVTVPSLKKSFIALYKYANYQ